MFIVRTRQNSCTASLRLNFALNKAYVRHPTPSFIAGNGQYMSPLICLSSFNNANSMLIPTYWLVYTIFHWIEYSPADISMLGRKYFSFMWIASVKKDKKFHWNLVLTNCRIAFVFLCRFRLYFYISEICTKEVVGPTLSTGWCTFVRPNKLHQCFFKWANPGLFFCLFSSFQHVTI